MQWFYADSGTQRGPVSEEEFQELTQRGVIDDSTLVWNETLENWQPWGALRSADAALSQSTNPNTGTQLPSFVDPSAPGGASEEAGDAQADRVICAECGQRFLLDDTIVFGNQRVCATCKPRFIQRLREGAVENWSGATDGVWLTREQIEAREYSIDAVERISESWRLNFSKPSQYLMGGILGLMIMGGIQLISVIVNLIPLVGMVISTVVVTAAAFVLMGGLMTFYAEASAGKNPAHGRIFAGYGPRFWPLVKASMPLILIQLVMMGPVTLIGVLGAGVTFTPGTGGPPTLTPQGSMALIMLASGFALIGAIAYIYFNFHWMYAPALIVDKKLPWLDALKLSYRVAHKHPWQTLWLWFLTAILMMASLLACLVGIFIGFPVATAASSIQYQRLFGDLKPETEDNTANP